MTYNVTHVTITEDRPPWVNQQPEIVAIIRDISPRREEEPEEVLERVGLEDDEPEIKVVKRGRRPAPKANEAAETK